MSQITKKSFSAPEQTLEFDKFKAEVVTVHGVQVSRCTCEPGWVFSQSVAPKMGVESCPAPHPIWLVLSGRIAIQMDGSETVVEYGPGELGEIPPGHEAWVVGDEPCVAIDVALSS